MEPVARVHTDRYLRFLQQAHARWCTLDDAAPEVIPNAFPVAPEAGYPTSVAGQAGFHMGDMACPINAGTWRTAYGSAQVALSDADAVLNGASVSYGLRHPPGHHAYADRATGYCFLNNAAIAAQHCLDRGCALEPPSIWMYITATGHRISSTPALAFNLSRCMPIQANSTGVGLTCHALACCNFSIFDFLDPARVRLSGFC